MARVTYIGGPTAIIEIAGLRLLTDPTFDPPGEYPIGNRVLTKTDGPGMSIDDLGAIDVVLLSHDQHPDNLDAAGRALLPRVPLVLSTGAAAARIDGVRALENWADIAVDGLTITGLPAVHGPPGTEHLVGDVIGFLLYGPPTVYVSGDNASLDVVRSIAARTGPIDIAVLFAGGARTPLVDGFLTLSSDAAAEAASILDARHVVAVHFEHWAHLTNGATTLSDAFSAARIADRLHLLKPGQHVVLD